MAEYTPLTIPPVPTPAPLPESPTDAQRAAWESQMRLLMQREDLLSLHYERWHIQQHRAASLAATAASTAAQAQRAEAEHAVALAGHAAAQAQAATAAELALPTPVGEDERALREGLNAALQALATALTQAPPVVGGNTDLAKLVEVAQTIKAIKEALA